MLWIIQELEEQVSILNTNFKDYFKEPWDVFEMKYSNIKSNVKSSTISNSCLAL